MHLDLLWAANFSKSDDLDDRLWNFESGDGSELGIPGWGNNERQIYTREAARIEDGLRIDATRINPAIAPDCYYGKAEWQSSRMHTSKKLSFRYGRIQAIAKPPAGLGSWPAIWMLGESIGEIGWPSCGEIDIFEYAGNRPLEVCGTVHALGYSGERGIGSTCVAAEALHERFHTYGIDWLPDQITWHIDGAPFFKIRRSDLAATRKFWPFNKPHFLIMNLAMGGWFGGEIAQETGDCVFNIKSIEHYAIDGIGESIKAS